MTGAIITVFAQQRDALSCGDIGQVYVGQTGPAIDQVDRSRKPRAAVPRGCADKQVIEAIAIHIPRRGDGTPRKIIRATIKGDALIRGKSAQLDRSQGAAAINHIGCPGIAPAVISVTRADDHIIEPVTVHVPGAGDGKPGLVAPVIAPDDEAQSGRKPRQVRHRRGLKHIGDGDRHGLTGGLHPVAGADDDVIDVVATRIARALEIGRGVEGDGAGVPVDVPVDVE